MRSFDSWMIFSENFHASYKDSKFDRLMLSELFGENAPKEVNRESIQAALEDIMNHQVETTHEWWDQTRAKHGERWREEV